jgi:regulatory protein
MRIRRPDAAAAFLAVRPRSVEETRRRLRHLGYPAAPIEVVIDRLLAYGYRDDEAFARAWVESRDRARPRGEAALRRELVLKGVDGELIAAILAERGDEVGAPARRQ